MLTNATAGGDLFLPCGETNFTIYEREDVIPSEYTACAFEVPDAEATIKRMKAAGISSIHQACVHMVQPTADRFPQMERLTTKELSNRTFPDFAHLFAPGQGWSTCGCLAYQGYRPPAKGGPLVRRDWALQKKRALVEAGQAHGILVYDGDEPVGWCQFGPNAELPIRRGGAMAQVFPDGPERIWRITCFVTHKAYRGRGVSRVALRAVLRAIRTKGGGLAEAYPVVVVRADPAADPRRARVEEWNRELNRVLTVYGGRSPQARHHLSKRVEVTEQVDGLGLLDATYWQGFHGGTVPLFAAEGFRAVSVIPSRGRLAAEPTSRPARVLMRKMIRA